MGNVAAPIATTCDEQEGGRGLGRAATLTEQTSLSVGRGNNSFSWRRWFAKLCVSLVEATSVTEHKGPPGAILHGTTLTGRLESVAKLRLASACLRRPPLG